MKFWGLLGLLQGAAATDVYGAVAGAACTGKVGCAGYYRAFGVTTSPPGSDFGPPSNVTGLSIGAIGAQAAGANGVGTAHVDVAGFRFKTPADNSDPNNHGLSFYFGYLGINGAWNNGTQTANVAGAMAEVIASLSSVNVYYDHDGVPGFQWGLTAAAPSQRFDIYDCTNAATKNYDCVDTNAKINFATDLSWTNIDHTKVMCASAPGLTSTDYTAGCEIHSLTTIGYLPTGSSANPVVTFTIRIASQPVLINGIAHGPDYAKWDLQINFPWSSFPNILDLTNARLALVTVAAGKAGAFTGAAQRNNGVDSMSFQAAGMPVRSYYSYNASIMVDGQASTVYTQIVTGQNILDAQCVAPSPCFGIAGLTLTNGLIASLKLSVGAMAVFGWKASIAIHSFGTKAQPLAIQWDPTVGAGDATNSAMLAVPSTLLLAVVALLLQ